MRAPWLLFFASSLAIAFGSGLAACNYACGNNQTAVPVRERDPLASSSDETVCVDDRELPTTTTATSSGPGYSYDSGAPPSDDDASQGTPTGPARRERRGVTLEALW